MTDRKIIIINQAVNYLTIRISNVFNQKFKEVILITGSVHEQGESLSKNIHIENINSYIEKSTGKKFISYLIACWKIFLIIKFKYRKHELFFISLPPMAYLLNIVLKNRFSIIIWDVYPDVLKITGMKESNIIFKIWSWLNRISFRKAFRIFTVSEKMADLLQKYVKRENIIIQPLWSIFRNKNLVPKTKNPFIKIYGLAEKFVIQYSGNIGLTHNVEIIIKLAELLKNERDIIFQIIGRGSRVLHIKNMIKEKNLPNCVFIPFQSDKMFLNSLSAADLGIVVLNEITSMGSVPSKSYNLMSLGIPSLYFASPDSELYDYVLKYRHGKCYTEKEINKAIDYVLSLKNNRKLWQEYSKNSLRASEDFQSRNADNIVNKYLDIYR